MSRIPRSFLALLLLVPAAFGALPAVAEEPAPDTDETAPVDVGRQIYLEGTSPSVEAEGGEEILAILDGGAQVPAAALPCGNCHGLDGRGRPEGGVTPSNLVWTALTRPHGVRHETGREHPPYDERSLRKAIAMGVDPAGQTLHAAMPRYRMSRSDMDALVAYLKILGTESAPGVDAERLRVGVLTPPGDLDGEAMRAALDAYAAEVNDQGGIYGRSLQVVPVSSLDEADADSLFALLGGAVSGREQELTAWAASKAIPVIGPYTLSPPARTYPDPHVFYFLSDAEALVQVLLRAAVAEATTPDGEIEPRRWLILAPEDHPGLGAGRKMLVENPPPDWQADEQAVPPGEAPPESAAALARRLAAGGATDVLALTPVALSEPFLRAAAEAGWTPRVHSLGVLAAPTLVTAPVAFDGRLHLVFPSLPGDARGGGGELYSRLVEERGLVPRRGTAERVALAAAEIFTEVLKRVGRDVSRRALMTQLETTFYDHPTGLVPPLTFTPNRRVGARGGYRMTVDLAARTFRPDGGFRSVP